MQRILTALLTIALVVGAVAVGTAAYFSDTEETGSGNTFSAGTLDLNLQDASETWANGLTSTWVSPANWAPGDPEVNAWLDMRNVGSIGADLVSVRGGALTEADNGYNDAEGAGSADNVADFIYVTTIRYTEGGVDLYGNLAGWYATALGDGIAPLTLRELAGPSAYSMVFWIGGWPPASDYLPASAARVETIWLGFTFDSNAGDAYQSDIASFAVTVTAVQDYSQITLLGKGPGLCYGISE